MAESKNSAYKTKGTGFLPCLFTSLIHAIPRVKATAFDRARVGERQVRAIISAWKHRDPAAEQDWVNVDAHFIDQPGGEQTASKSSSTHHTNPTSFLFLQIA